jgi:mono/diheme cytochrome c family protein
MASDVVRPFKLNNSDMYEVITDNDPDDRMPQPPNERLTTAQIAVIAKWILQGAEDLTCDEVGECNTTSISYSGFIAPLLINTCVGCHSGTAPSGNVLLSTYAGVREVALNGRLHGAITWANGYQQMPRGSGQLPACTIDKIKAWIDDGAQNN